MRCTVAFVAYCKFLCTRPFVDELPTSEGKPGIGLFFDDRVPGGVSLLYFFGVVLQVMNNS